MVVDAVGHLLTVTVIDGTMTATGPTEATRPWTHIAHSLL